jgi:ribosome modulation factor
MKLRDILQENNFKHPAWQEGNDAFWNGHQPNHCPYEEGEEKTQWLAGWKQASLASDD